MRPPPSNAEAPSRAGAHVQTPWLGGWRTCLQAGLQTGSGGWQPPAPGATSSHLPSGTSPPARPSPGTAARLVPTATQQMPSKPRMHPWGERLWILSPNRSEKALSQLDSVINTMDAQFRSEHRTSQERGSPPARQDREHISRVSGCLGPCTWKRRAVHTVLPKDERSEGSPARTARGWRQQGRQESASLPLGTGKERSGVRARTGRVLHEPPAAPGRDQRPRPAAHTLACHVGY